MNAAALFPNPRTDASHELHHLAARRGELNHEVRELHRQLEAAGRELEQARRATRAAEVEAFATGGDTAPIAKAKKAVSAAEKRAGELEHQAGVARAAVEHIDSQLRAHVTETIDELMAELREDADAAQAGLAQALEAASQAHGHWQAVATRVTGVLALAELGRDYHVSDLPQRLTEMARRIGQHASDVSPPFPRHWRVVQPAAVPAADTEADLLEVYEDAA